MTRAPIPVGQPPALDAAFLRASEVFEATVARVPGSAWDDASPCAGWTVRDVVGHVVGTVVEMAAIVRDEPFSREPGPPGDAAGDDPVASLRAVLGPARDAFRTGDLARPTDAMHDRPVAERAGPSAARTVSEALAFPVADLVVHAWDVAHATGPDLELPDELLAHVVHTSLQVPDEVLRGPGLFGPSRPVADGADDTARVMAWLGRDTAR